MSGDVDFVAVDETPRRNRLDGSFLSLVLAVMGVSGALVWSMAVHDPYWRLFQGGSVPARTYETDSDMRAAMLVALQEFGNPETAAVSPETVKQPGGFVNTIALGDATEARVPEPKLAMIPALDDAGSRRQVADVAPRIARAPDSIADMPDLMAGASFTAPTSLVPVSGRATDPFPQAATELALSPFAEPQTPAQPRIIANEVTEEALALQRRQRSEVQRRLALAGFDPRGFDGIFGPNTRSAITDFQTAWGYPATGYLEDAVYAELSRRTEDAYQALRRRAAQAPAAAPDLARNAADTEVATADGKCARRSDGRIIERQGLACDMAGFAEQFVSLGRTSIGGDSEQEVDTAPLRSASLATTVRSPRAEP